MPPEKAEASERWKFKDPPLAAFLAWLIPGAGHFYQGRRIKATIFATNIALLYMAGLWLGDFRVVYASNRPQDRRWPFLCQAGVGAAAIPALVQAYRVGAGKAPLFAGKFAPPNLGDRFNGGELDEIHYRLGQGWDLGQTYTMIAGLLNILAVYDALAGPAYAWPRGTGPPSPDGTKGKT